jgi:hypothetical protein
MRATRDIRRLATAAALLLAVVTACGSPTVEREADAVESDADLTDLAALPYLSWSDEEADPGKLGVTLYDENRAWNGVNLYTNDVNEAYLMGMTGRRLHTWTLPSEFDHCEHFELLRRGQIVAVCSPQALVRLDWDSNVVWINDITAHHDVALLPDESMLVPFGEPLREFNGRQVGFDGIARISMAGETLETWSTFEHLAELHRHFPAIKLDSPPQPGARPRTAYDYFHLNTVEILPETPLGRADSRFRSGNILLCLRNVHTLVILDRDTWDVVWSWGYGELSFPHMPTMLESGRILVYDNGVRNKMTRVLELDPASEEIVWSYPSPPRRDFYSMRRGSNQRLPNGNTLIAESEKGHVIEVTPKGELVWEFWNPELKGTSRKRIYRFMRMGEDQVRQLVRGDRRPTGTP